MVFNVGHSTLPPLCNPSPFIHHPWFIPDALFPIRVLLSHLCNRLAARFRAGHTLSCRNYFADLHPISVTRSSSASSVFWTPSYAALFARQRSHRSSVKYTFVGGLGTVTAGRLFIFPVTVIFQTRTGRRINVPGCFWRAWKIRRRPRRRFSRSLPRRRSRRGANDKDPAGLRYNLWFYSRTSVFWRTKHPITDNPLFCTRFDVHP